MQKGVCIATLYTLPKIVVWQNSIEFYPYILTEIKLILTQYKLGNRFKQSFTKAFNTKLNSMIIELAAFVIHAP